MMRAMIRRPTNLSSAVERLARNAHREQQKQGISVSVPWLVSKNSKAGAVRSKGSF
jgi:hypothetical protein